jgi:dCMP deaminase
MTTRHPGDTRPSWTRYALALADVAATRSADPFVQIGAVVLRPDHSVAGIGYNGAPSGIEVDGLTREERRPIMIHAEVNALRYCTPVEVRGGLVAVTGTPCPSCLTTISAHGITRVAFSDLLDNYPLIASQVVASRLGITLANYRRNE